MPATGLWYFRKNIIHNSRAVKIVDKRKLRAYNIKAVLWMTALMLKPLAPVEALTYNNNTGG